VNDDDVADRVGKSDMAIWPEDERAAAITAFDLDDLIDDPHLDAICRFVADQCGVPIALVSLVEATEQRFIGRAGTALRGTPRSTSFCATAMMTDSVMVVPDARDDARFADYTIVTGDAGICFYAGAPLITPDGVPLGALCVLDTVPRTDLTDAQIAMLAMMAQAVMDRLVLRRSRREGALAVSSAAEVTEALNASELRFRVLIDAMPQMAWSSRSDGHTDYFNARWYEFTGLTVQQSAGSGWTSALHPSDVEPAIAAWHHSVETGKPYDIEYRLRRADGEYRWALARGLPVSPADGSISRWFGTCTDIHDHKIALEEREIISQELSHRIKNIFAVISGLIGLAARGAPAFADTAETLRQRILALGRAHDFVRPHSQRSRPAKVSQNSLFGLLDEIFAPYQDYPGGRFHISGTDIRIDDRSATPLALMFHEASTNAAKYGALSTDSGQIALSIKHEDDRIEMVWQESGGPNIAPVTSTGFGTQLLELAIKRQLGGDFQQIWNPDGLELRIQVPVKAFSRRS
jgi:PAS domain S-box-containing protein